ncbi:phage tail tape measure protein [Bacillus velezensis]|uniref:phage tail tape measure protein n=2 Tax=Bacillus subtilis group TaxID=653685 RepID=UPI0011A7AEF3|nr:phage tail tape measure protein [Bacillus velezensis]
MASNRIGIEVQVEFPTVAELQKQLAEKWSKVKNGFEGKINIGVDGHSLNKVKSKIQDALDGKDFKIKLDSKFALAEIGLIQKELKQLDEKIDKVREIKIKFDMADMDKSMKEIIENNQKIQEGMDKTNSKTKEQTSDLERQVGTYDKITRKIKEINGKVVTTQIKTTQTTVGGNTSTATIDANGVTYDETEDRKRALKEIQDVMTRIHRIEMESMNAEGDHLKILQDEKKIQNQQLELLKTMYYQKHKVNAITTTDLMEVKRMQEVVKSIAEAKQFQQALNEQQREQAGNVQKVITLEQKIHSLKMKQVSALESEQASLNEQVAHYERIKAKVQEKLTGENKITAEQQDQINNLKAINSLELSRANEKKKQQAIDAKMAQDQREANQKLMSDLKEIHSLQSKITQITSRRDAGGKFGNDEQAQLNVLEHQLRVRADLAQQTRENLRSQGLVTTEMGEQLQRAREINQAELRRISNAQRVVAENDKASAKIKEQDKAYQELLQAERNIIKLQRDLIYSGMREKEIIREAVRAEQAKASAMAEELHRAGALTQAREQEIAAIRRAASEQEKLNSRRRSARERDQAYNDTGGLIDPFSTYANGRQAFEAILQPMKEIDESFVKVAKVADASEEALQKFKDTSFDVGSSLGTSAADYMKAVETWVTAGKTFEESQELGKISQIGSFVGNITPDDMVKYMSVPLKAYEKEGLKANDVINAMNEVANNNAIEMNDLGKAYMRSATSAKNAGASFGDLTGMITAAQEATRKGGERIGTAIKTIGLNITAIQSRFSKDNRKKYDFLSDVIGIDMEDKNGEAKSLTDIIKQLSQKWDGLSKTEKGNASIMIAGKEHAETLQAIIEQYKTMAKVQKETDNQIGQGKDGSAYIEFAKQSDSLRFKLAELKNMWDKLMVTLGDSDGTMAHALDGLISGLKILGTLAQNPAVIALLKAIAGIMVIHAGANGVKRLFDTISTGTKGAVKTGIDVFAAWKNIRGSIDEATAAVGRFEVAERGARANAPNGTGNINGRSNGTNNQRNTAAYGGSSVYLDANGREARDRNGNRIGDPRNSSPMTDANGYYLRDRSGNHIYDPRDSDTRRYTDTNGNELRDRQGNAIVNPERDNPNANANAARQAEESANRTSGAIKGVGKALGKTLELVPLLGDALVLMEIAGFPVFEKMGEGFSKMFKSAKDTYEETERVINKFKGQNDLINGRVDATRNKVSDLENQLGRADVAKTNKKGDPIHDKTGNLVIDDKGKGYMEDEDAFKKFKSEFNAEAENLGLVDKNGVKIRIDMNDTTDIMNKMKALNAEKKKLEQEANIKVAKQIDDDTYKLKGSKDDVAKAKLEYDQAMERVAKAKKMVKSLVDENGKIDNPEAYVRWATELDAAQKDLKKTKSTVETTTKTYDKQRKAILDNARALMSEGKSFDASKLSKEQAVSVTKAMLVEYKKMKTTSNSLATTQNKLKNGTKLTNDEFRDIIKRFPEYENAGKGKIETDKNIRKELVKKMGKERESADASIKAGEAAMTSAGKEAGMTKEVQGAIESKTGATKKSEDAVKDLTKAAKDIPAEKSLSVKIKTWGLSVWKEIKSWFGAGDESKTVTAHVKESGGGGGKKKSSVEVGTTRTTGTRRSSASVATGTPVRGAGAVVSASKASKSKGEQNNSRVSEEVWRYWNTEDKQTHLESAMRDLERAITDAKDDYKKVISALTKEISNLKSQQSVQRTLYSQKDSEMNSVLNKLKKYGFKVNTSSNTISNLGHAKSLKGTKAEQAETLLQTWHSLTSELLDINGKIKDINSQIKQTQDQIKEQKIAKELKSFESQLKRVNALLTSVGNSDSLFNTKLSLIDSKDKELSLKTNEEAMAKSKTNMASLIKEFNALSLKTVAYKENGEQLKSTLDSLGQQIISQADNIIKYRQAINDLEFSRITEDVTKFGNAVEKQDNKLVNNMNNLKEGLLSGTDLNDLASAKDEILDLSRNNVYEKQAQERINLEKEVSDALTAYAKKNVDRVKKVANSTLDVNAKMYNQLLKMQKDYTNGNKVSAKKLSATYGDLDDIAKIDKDYANKAKNLEKYFEDIKKKEDALTKKYNADMAKTKDARVKDALTDKYLSDGLNIQKQYYEALIKGNNQAIKELNSQLADASDDDKQKIKDQIASYEQSNIDTQNKIKDTIKARFDFELSLMNEVITKTGEAKTALQNTYDLLSSLGTGNYAGKGTLLDAMRNMEKQRNAQIKESIAKLQKQQKLYEVGSYEWNIINDEVSQFNSQLVDSNKQLIEMNKNILANSFGATSDALERRLFDGKSHDAWQQHQQLWMEGLEKEIALEKMYKRMADLGTTANKEKLDLLAKEEQLSKYEMDRLNKQLDIIELQQKVDNLSKEKTIQTLKQNEFGQWDWVYEADATQLDKAKDDLAQAQLALQQMQDKAREDYLTQLNKILTDAQNGEYDSAEDFRKAMEDLGQAFDSAVGDIPEIRDEYIDKLVEDYIKYMLENEKVVKDENPTTSYLNQATATMTDALRKTFTDISSQLGEIFANALLDKLPNTSVNATKAVRANSTAISIDKVEFPNATNKDEIQAAILGLPQKALQKANSKV